MMKNSIYLISVFICTLNSRLFSQDFYAYYSKVDSAEPFEAYSRTSEHADLIVQLGRPKGRLVFWRGSSYLPYWETAAGKWPVPELVRRTGDGPSHMPDRVNTYSHVQL